MAESVKEVVPETRPRGQRRGLDRLRASGTGEDSRRGQDNRVSQPPGAPPEPMPARTTVRDAPTAVAPQAAAPASTGVLEAPAESPAEASAADGSAPAAPAAAPAAVSPAESAPGSPAAQPSRHVRLLAAGIALLVLLVGWLGYRLWHTHAAAQADRRHYQQLTVADARNQAVLSAARQAAVTLLTYDYRHLDKDFAAVLNGSTGGFKKDFAGKSATAKTLFTQGKAIASGQVLDAAVASSTPDSATVLAVLDQTVKNVSVPNGTVKHYRMQLKLDKVGSAWLVSDVEFPA